MRIKRLVQKPNYGRQVVDKVRSSTGIYGKHGGGPVPNNAVRVRRGSR